MTKTSTETAYGRYIIKAMRAGEVWRARAFRRNDIASPVESAPTEEAAILAVKTALDAKNSAERARRSDGYPTADEVREALSHVSMSKGQESMLLAHLQAPDHVLTARQLAEAAGYKDLAAANLQYGLLGRALAEELDWELAARLDGERIWTFTLATEAGHGGDLVATSPEWRWRLRPQIVEALAADRPT